MISTAATIRTAIATAMDGLGYIRSTENQIFTEVTSNKLYSLSGVDLNPTSTGANLLYYFDVQNSILIRFNVPVDGFFSSIDTIESTLIEAIHDSITKSLQLPIRVNVKILLQDEQTATYSVTISTQFARRLT